MLGARLNPREHSEAALLTSIPSADCSSSASLHPRHTGLCLNAPSIHARKPCIFCLSQSALWDPGGGRPSPKRLMNSCAARRGQGCSLFYLELERGRSGAGLARLGLGDQRLGTGVLHLQHELLEHQLRLG